MNKLVQREAFIDSMKTKGAELRDETVLTFDDLRVGRCDR